ncbi:hypothetical protein MMC34_001237 [Xylographa carneopallida]|nr:hypothetical protein [Xylographa carneopallida]
MESVMDTPIKRRKTENGHVDSQSYNSQDDSGDDLFADFETVATVPLTPNPGTRMNRDKSVSPASYVTQPTQILDRGLQGQGQSNWKPSLVQVAASSPVKAPSIPSPASKSGGILASVMAPPGTTFQLPIGVSKPPLKPAVIDLSDDELSIRYRGGLSDDDSQRDRATIKPSTFIQRVQQQAKLEKEATPKGLKKFNEITSKSFYKPLEVNEAKRPASTLSGSIYDSRNRDENNTSSRITATKRSADVMANAYGNFSRPQKQVRQMLPAKARPVEITSPDDVPDWSYREKLRRILTIVPSEKVNDCYLALIDKKGNIDDALNALMSEERKPSQIDLTISDDEPAVCKPTLTQKPPAKQQLKIPNRTIQEKYASTQVVPRQTQVTVTTPVAQPKRKGKLVRGRKNASSPPLAVLSPQAPVVVARQHTPDSVDTDSGVGSEVEDDHVLDSTLLAFFNTCSVQDLADIAAIGEGPAKLLLSRRPFRTLDEVRQVSDKPMVANTKKRGYTKRPMGEKIVDTCQTVWAGYEAVDELVKECETLGKPLAEEMRQWGIDVFGSKNGELELVNFTDLSAEKNSPRSAVHDSGIGTPVSGSSAAVSGDEDIDGDILMSSESRARTKRLFLSQPAIMAPGVTLKDYQVVGINWLSLLFGKKLSCILADDMGLGKTCQVVAFLASLFEKGIKGPHLIIVPGSTLENWLREFQNFCPALDVMPYYAGKNERPEIQDEILDRAELPNVIITTYGIAKVPEDNKFLRRLKPSVCVFDEGHHLKNSMSKVYQALMRIPAEFRLLLTGTPLQNNLGELASLLGFILPNLFKKHSEELESIFNHRAKTTDGDHSALLSAQRIARARSMMTPFILRRKKHQVLKHLPPKVRRVEYCDLLPSQHALYTAEQERFLKNAEARKAGIRTGMSTTNNMMNLRKASIHPLLFRQNYDDKTLSKMAKQATKEDVWRESDVDLVYEDMTVMTDFELHRLCVSHPDHLSSFVLDEEKWMDSGKVAKLCELLTAFKANGDRVLVFSQFTMVMNILESVMETLGMQFFRLDGDTNINERQPLLDQFYAEEDITVFMLSTKAGGQGINLACANKVIIFDSSFNPQEDIQAENRAHRVGQTRDVEVIRLVTRGTIEENIHQLGETKLALDDRVAGEGAEDADNKDIQNKKAEAVGEKLVAEMMLAQIEGKNIS